MRMFYIFYRFICMLNILFMSMYVLLFISFPVSSLSANLNNVPILNGTNYTKWKQHIMIMLGCMDLDLALRIDRPAADAQNYEKWDRSNRMSLMIIQSVILDTIRGSITEENSAKEFLKQLADRFTANEKVEASTLLNKLTSMRYKSKGSIREYIMEMSNVVTRLRAIKLELSDDILVHMILNSLPPQYDTFKISYNTQKEK
ncbi:hypothetical protein Dimus_038497 [Dionaea muscipula]